MSCNRAHDAGHESSLVCLSRLAALVPAQPTVGAVDCMRLLRFKCHSRACVVPCRRNEGGDCACRSFEARQTATLTTVRWEARPKVDMLATRPAAMLPAACAKAISRRYALSQMCLCQC